MWNQKLERVSNFKKSPPFSRRQFFSFSVFCFQPSLPNLLTMVSDLRFKVRGETIERGVNWHYLTGLNRKTTLSGPGRPSWAQSWFFRGFCWEPLPVILMPEALHFSLLLPLQVLAFSAGHSRCALLGGRGGQAVGGEGGESHCPSWWFSWAWF